MPIKQVLLKKQSKANNNCGSEVACKSFNTVAVAVGAKDSLKSSVMTSASKENTQPNFFLGRGATGFQTL